MIKLCEILDDISHLHYATEVYSKLDGKIAAILYHNTTRRRNQIINYMHILGDGCISEGENHQHGTNQAELWDCQMFIKIWINNDFDQNFEVYCHQQYLDFLASTCASQ